MQAALRGLLQLPVLEKGWVNLSSERVLSVQLSGDPVTGILFVLGSCRCLLKKRSRPWNSRCWQHPCEQNHPSHTWFMLDALFSPPLVWSFCFTVCFSWVCWMLSLSIFDLGKGEFMGKDKRLKSFSAGTVTTLVWIPWFWLRPNDLWTRIFSKPGDFQAYWTWCLVLL